MVTPKRWKFEIGKQQEWQGLCSISDILVEFVGEV